MLRPLLEGLAVAPRTSNEVEMVRRVLLSRPRLETVIDETALSARANSPVARASLMNELSLAIRLTGDPQSHLYTIVYGDHDPKVSYEVVQNLLDAFLGQAVGEKRSDSENAQKFLVAQLAEYEKRLSESERKLAEFKRKNVGFMPDDRGGYFERLQQGNAGSRPARGGKNRCHQQAARTSIKAAGWRRVVVYGRFRGNQR